MAITVDHKTHVISIPKADLTPLPSGRFQLDANALRLELKDYEDGPGMSLPDTTFHETVSVLSGVAYARKISFINGFTVEFEDGQYQVDIQGANHNIADVQVQNQVGLLINNSAGLIQAGTSLTAVQSEMLADILWRLGLDPLLPLTNTPDAITAGAGSPEEKRIDVTGDGETSSTLTRNDP